MQSVWNLFTSGSVGSQALVGIPCVAKIRNDTTLKPFSKVWPFETWFAPIPSPATGPFVLYAEIWPILFNAEVMAQGAADPKLEILDQAQVRALCAWVNSPTRRVNSARSSAGRGGCPTPWRRTASRRKGRSLACLGLTSSDALPRRAPIRRFSFEIWQTSGTASHQRFRVTRK
ncbi:hypothetical protein [Sorangium sp. So ce861]|uniref:hypothetical protein n=1 Tax=Sorangium sp. So ce861 TaxID=3133323 RepID=UPI003F5EC441